MDYSNENNRLVSFAGWNTSKFKAEPSLLSNAGFYRIGNDENDSVQCFCCGSKLSDWSRRSHPRREHALANPDCAYLTRGDPSARLQREENPYMHRVGRNDINADRLLKAPPNSPTAEHMESLEINLMSYSLERNFPAHEPALVSNAGTVQDSVASQDSELLPDESEAAGASCDPARKDIEDVEDGIDDHRRQEDAEEVIANKDVLIEILDRLQREKLCKVCCQEDASILFLKCGHIVCCATCAPVFRECPVCRGVIRGSVRVLFSDLDDVQPEEVPLNEVDFPSSQLHIVRTVKESVNLDAPIQCTEDNSAELYTRRHIRHPP